MTTKAYWPQRVENVQMDMRDTDGRPDTSGSWLSDDEDGESMKKTFKNGKVQVRSTDVEKNHSANSKTGGDEVVGSTSLYDENGKIRLVPVRLAPSHVPLCRRCAVLIMVVRFAK